MPDTILESALSGSLDWDLLSRWLNNDSIEGAPEDCILHCSNRNEFVAHFLSYLRNQTDSILQTNTNALPIPQHQGTPEKSFGRNHHRSISDPTCDNDNSNDSLQVKPERKTQESPNRERKKQGRRVKAKLFPEEKKDNLSLSSDESRISIGVERIIISSTPMKNGINHQNLPSSPKTPSTPQSKLFKDFERCDTPRLSRHSRPSDKSVSLADYLVNVQPKSSKKKRSKNTSHDDSETKTDLDLSNSEIFPEIGSRKSSSLKSDRRRIKPTNIDRSKKSYSLNSFTPEVFQQPPLGLEENLAFKPKLQESSSIEIERNILKQDRHKLMEKFNILNTSTTPKQAPQIKILKKENMNQKNYIEADVSKIVFIDKINILINVYDILIKNNLILSINTEIYYLISILLSKQVDDDYVKAESQMENTISLNILKTIHNSTYFAIKSLWNVRGILEVILDKGSLKMLGENRKVRSFFPDLAKFLLNSYGLKCEAESNERRNNDRVSNGMVCFNHETDNVENFPSVLSFQNFKKQRDMFYEILRWYQDTHTTLSRSSLRARIKALLSSGASAANHAHLSTLFTHMLLETLPPNELETKLSKLQRRLTCPSATESHRLPQFSEKEMFYKEFVMYAENESFRVHLRDTLASEIIALDSTPMGNESSNGADTSKEFLICSKKLALLSKFLGYLTSLPYAQIPIDILLKTGVTNINNQNEIFTAPKEKVLENYQALRNYSQPTIDIKGLLETAIENGRLIITLPWIIHYLSMLDYTTLRLKYYKNLLNIIFSIYEKKLKVKDNKITIIYLKTILSWLFDLPHFPQELFYERSDIDVKISDIEYNVDESVLFELCPFLKDVNVLLSTSRVSEKESFRHITPVSLSLNSEDRIRNKEKELQTRLEEELLKSQPSSTRRVLEVVTERVSSAIVKELAHTLAVSRKRANANASDIVANCKDKTTLLNTLQAMYTEHLEKLRTDSLESCKTTVRNRVSAALTALLPTAPLPLHAVASRACYNRLNKWINDHWATSAVLCKDIEDEMNNLLQVGDTQQVHVPPTCIILTKYDFNQMESPASTIIALKEQICLLLDYEDTTIPTDVLKACANCCLQKNVFNRAPAQRAILQLSVDFCVVYVSRKMSKIKEVLPDLHLIWDTCCPDRQQIRKLDLAERRPELSPTFRNYDDRAPTPVSDEEKEVKVIEIPKPEKPEKVEPKPEKSDESNGLLEYFDRILCPRNVVLLSESKCDKTEIWKALADVMVFLLENSYLSEDSLTEQCLAVYRQDWPQNILENLSTCMKSVSSRWTRSSMGKFTLFLEFLADYCNDMDYDLVE